MKTSAHYVVHTEKIEATSSGFEKDKQSSMTIQKMFKELVRGESPVNPGNCSRLRLHEDVICVLNLKEDTVRLL